MNYRFDLRYTGPIRALITDLAGTSVDYGSCAPVAAFMELFCRQGIKITAEQARVPMGLQKRDHIRAIANLSTVDSKWRELKGRSCIEADIDKMYAEFIPLQLEVLPRYSVLIPGLLDTVKRLKKMGVMIGVTTGYNREMMQMVLAEAKDQGFVPASVICATDVPAGRPAPWMIFRPMELLDVYPPEAVAVIGDTIPDIEAGLNAGVWTIAVAKTGNMLGLDEKEAAALDPDKLQQRLASAYEQLSRAGANYVIDSIADCASVIEHINLMMGRHKGLALTRCWLIILLILSKRYHIYGKKGIVCLSLFFVSKISSFEGKYKTKWVKSSKNIKDVKINVQLSYLN